MPDSVLQEITFWHGRFTACLAADPADTQLETLSEIQQLSMEIDAVRKEATTSDEADDKIQRVLDRYESSCPALTPIIEAIANQISSDKEEELDFLKHLATTCETLRRFHVTTSTELQDAEVRKLSGYLCALNAASLPASPEKTTTSIGDSSSSDKVSELLEYDDILSVRECYEQLLNNDKLPPIALLTELMTRAKELFSKEPNVLDISCPTVIVGDVHGQMRDLKQKILASGGPLGEETYLFLGDYVDRGEASLEVITILASAKILFPDKVFLIRGNHESRNTNGFYGFLSECHTKYPQPSAQGDSGSAAPSPCYPRSPFLFGQGGHPLWGLINGVFDTLPIAAVVANKIFCVHGGLSPAGPDLASMMCVQRKSDITVGGVLADVTWSDPYDGLGFTNNSRGCGHLFGPDVSDAFCQKHALNFVCRGHQCVRGGYLWSHGERVVTLFSAPNYCGQGNLGAIMKVDAAGCHSFISYRSVTAWDTDEEEEDDGSGASDNSNIDSPKTPPTKEVPSFFSL